LGNRREKRWCVRRTLLFCIIWGMNKMYKASDFHLLQVAYDYQFNQKDTNKAIETLKRLIIEYPDSEYIKIAKERLTKMGFSSEIDVRFEKENLQIEHQKYVNQLKEAIPSNIKSIINKYEGTNIKINYRSLSDYENALLIKVSDDLFSVYLGGSLICHFPFRYVISLAEAKKPDGQNFLAIQIYHQFIQTPQGLVGGVGIGVLFDIGNLF